MTKNKFTELLDKRIQVLNRVERLRILCFYEETIDDCMEDGMSEEEAVASLGDLDTIVNDILTENKIAVEEKSSSSFKNLDKKWRYTILFFTSPLWLSVVAVGLTLVLIGYLLIGIAFFLAGVIWILPAIVCLASVIALPFQIFHNFAYSVLVLGIFCICFGCFLHASLEIKAWFLWIRTYAVKLHTWIQQQSQAIYIKVVC